MARGGARRRRTRPPEPAGRREIAHQVDGNGRRLVDPQHADVMEVGLLDPALLQRRPAPEGAADAEDDPALDLRLDRVGVPHRAAVHRANDAMHADLARFGHRGFGDRGEITAPPAVEDGYAAAAAFRQWSAPTGLARRNVEDRLGPR